MRFRQANEVKLLSKRLKLPYSPVPMVRAMTLPIIKKVSLRRIFGIMVERCLTLISVGIILTKSSVEYNSTHTATVTSTLRCWEIPKIHICCSSEFNTFKIMTD